MSTTATTMAAVSAANASIAIQSEQRSKEFFCKGYVPNYNAQTADVAEMRQYSDCVRTLYPKTMDPTYVMVLKVTICLIFIAAIVGYILGVKEDGFASTTGPLLAFGCAVAAVVGLFVLALVMAGVSFLFTA